MLLTEILLGKVGMVFESCGFEETIWVGIQGEFCQIGLKLLNWGVQKKF